MKLVLIFFSIFVKSRSVTETIEKSQLCRVLAIKLNFETMENLGRKYPKIISYCKQHSRIFVRYKEAIHCKRFSWKGFSICPIKNSYNIE